MTGKFTDSRFLKIDPVLRFSHTHKSGINHYVEKLLESEPTGHHWPSFGDVVGEKANQEPTCPEFRDSIHDFRYDLELREDEVGARRIPDQLSAWQVIPRPGKVVFES